MTMTLIGSSTVGAGGATSITFESIPQDGSDLICYVSARSSWTGHDDLTVIVNGNTAANYFWKFLKGDTPSVSSGDAGILQTTAFVGNTTGTNLTANTFSNQMIYFTNYTSSLQKGFSGDSVNENAAQTAYQVLTAGRIANTAPITSITLDTSNGGSFVQNTTAYLYKISTTGATGATVS